jgi:antitoxin VapB
MVLSIKSDRADRLARDLAATTGETITDAVARAIEERLQRERARRRVRGDLAERLLHVAEDFRALPVIDDRSDDEFLGYGADGLPT